MRVLTCEWPWGVMFFLHGCGALVWPQKCWWTTSLQHVSSRMVHNILRTLLHVQYACKICAANQHCSLISVWMDDALLLDVILHFLFSTTATWQYILHMYVVPQSTRITNTIHKSPLAYLAETVEYNLATRTSNWPERRTMHCNFN
jgi:hypothetical protein